MDRRGGNRHVIPDIEAYSFIETDGKIYYNTQDIQEDDTDEEIIKEQILSYDRKSGKSKKIQEEYEIIWFSLYGNGLIYIGYETEKEQDRALLGIWTCDLDGKDKKELGKFTLKDFWVYDSNKFILSEDTILLCGGKIAMFSIKEKRFQEILSYDEDMETKAVCCQDGYAYICIEDSEVYAVTKTPELQGVWKLKMDFAKEKEDMEKISSATTEKLYCREGKVYNENFEVIAE
ncbi:MAG: hypothetical protein J1F22_06070 [Lachnospiraceae bacterium]|nr:hypothetical protein [Lachnospiraceae bacterium]